jgi:8-oxo-dGTP pyrophosphatase MutT (NUDIX family)
MSYSKRNHLNKLSKSLSGISSKEAILKVSFLNEIFCSDNFIIKNASCDDQILKLAKDLSKIATTYYGKGGAGLLLTCKEDGTVLMLKRSRHVEQPMTWGIPGGALSKGEGWHRRDDIVDSGFSQDDFLEAAFREADEELFSSGGLYLDKSKMTLIGETEFRDGGFTYKTFVYDIPLEEKKRITGSFSLNWENDKAKWYSLSDLPKNLHFGVKFTKDNLEEQGIHLFENRIDELDWIRNYLRGLLTKVGDQSEQLVKDLIEKVSVMIPTLSTKEQGEDYQGFRFKASNAVHEFFNYAIKEISRIGEKKVAMEMMNYASRFATKPKDKYGDEDNKRLMKLPSGDFSAHEGFLYHGSELRNAISILRSGTFVGAGAFTRLSLTPDLSVAAKFGDTIFVFDAKKLQRSGAKKMNYGTIATTERIREQSGKPVDENYLKNPWIPEMYRYEKEWVLRLPYQMQPGDLVKIIYFSNTRDRDTGGGYNNQYSSANEAFTALDAVTDVPVEVMNYPSFGSHSPSASKKVEPESANLTELTYSTILSEQATIEELERIYNEETDKRIWDKAYLSSSYRNDWIKSTIFKLRTTITDLGSYARQMDFKSTYDAGKILDFYRDIERVRDDIKSNKEPVDSRLLSWYNFSYSDIDAAREFFMPFINKIVDICDKILSKKEEFKSIFLNKQFGDPTNPQEENYIVRYFVYPSGEVELIRSNAREWCANNIDRVLSIPNIKEYLDLNGPKVYGENYSWYAKELNDYSISSRLGELIRYAEPSKVQDEVYIENFLSLIDSSKIESIPDDRLERISKRYLVEGK